MAQSFSADQTSISRRKVIAGLTGGVAVAGIATATTFSTDLLPSQRGGVPNWWDRQYWTLESGGMEEWSRQVGSTFGLRDGGGTIELNLVKVDPLLSAGPRPKDLARSRAFVAVFDGGETAAGLAGDRIYSVDHPEYGAMQIYMGRGATGRLEAVFN